MVVGFQISIAEGFLSAVEKAERLLNYRSKMTVKEGIIKLIRNLYNKDSVRKIE